MKCAYRETIMATTTLSPTNRWLVEHDYPFIVSLFASNNTWFCKTWKKNSRTFINLQNIWSVWNKTES